MPIPPRKPIGHRGVNFSMPARQTQTDALPRIPPPFDPTNENNIKIREDSIKGWKVFVDNQKSMVGLKRVRNLVGEEDLDVDFLTRVNDMVKAQGKKINDATGKNEEIPKLDELIKDATENLRNIQKPKL